MWLVAWCVRIERPPVHRRYEERGDEGAGGEGKREADAYRV